MSDHAFRKPAGAGQASSAWSAAARLISRWLDRRERIDELLASLGNNLSSAERARCHHLVFGVIRHSSRLEGELGRLVSHPPRFATRAILYVAGFELIESADSAVEDGMVAKIVHHAVEQAKHLASPAEARLVNAVVRKLATSLALSKPPVKLADAEALAEYFSHPLWLVKRWLLQFGAGPTRSLLEWNQQPAPVYARWRGVDPAVDWLTPTAWLGWYEVPSGRWAEIEPLLSSGQIYLQNPGTRFAVELLAPKPGEIVLDACAAPGGKSLFIADLIAAGIAAGKKSGDGRIIALDLPTARVDRLKENLSRANGVEVALVLADLLESPTTVLREHKLPETFDAILIDVPCSNTGVMRHRVDVKWRLQEGDFRKHASQQLALLHAATRLVTQGGRLVYSTCSIDSEENEKVIKAFFDSRAGGPFKLEKSVISYPWESGHDGAAAFLLVRTG